ncbi:MAG TPA: hypothetical protein VJU61_04860, partial [Polyangiaceae bacterium]|nr:hypothetical protein [Polyangiaceae bacterium]
MLRSSPLGRVLLPGAGRLASPPLERWLEAALLACALLSVATTVAIVAVLARETWEFGKVVPLRRLLLDTQW